MKFNKIMSIVTIVTILAIGALNLYLKYDGWDSCRSHHGVVYCFVAG